MTLPLQGVKVLDFTHAMAGPYCTRALSDLGADVIKIEKIEGDLTRGFNYQVNGQSGFFIQQNCGKKSIALNLKTDAAKDIIFRLLNETDVVVENFRTGVMESLGFGYEQLKSVKEDIILCSVSAFGQEGPYAKRRGADLVAQAMGGIQWMNGESEGLPLPAGVPVADVSGGIHACAAICAALFKRMSTGEGSRIDMALLDAVIPFHEFAIQGLIMSKGEERLSRQGSRYTTYAPYGVFATRDGYVNITAVDNIRWSRLCKAMNREELIEDKRFATPESRVENHVELYHMIEEWVNQFDTAEEIVELLTGFGVTCAKVFSIEEVLNDPHINYRKMFIEVEQPGVGRIKVIDSPFKYADEEVGVRSHAPQVGEHTTEVLKEAGYTEDEIQKMKGQGVVSGS